MTSDHAYAPVESMDLIGGDIALDLVNTLSDRESEEPKEKLGTYADLVTWAVRVHAVSAGLAGRLRKRAEEEPSAADRVLRDAKALREVVYRVFTEATPSPEDVSGLAEAAGVAAARRRLVHTDAGWRFAWPDTVALDRVLWPVALSAADLLVSEDAERVKECAADTCNWLFLDRSRNRSRRWCDMKDCGNRAKARRFQARQRRATD